MALVPEGQEIVLIKCDYCKKVATRIKMIKIGDNPNLCDQCCDACEQAELLRFISDSE